MLVFILYFLFSGFKERLNKKPKGRKDPPLHWKKWALLSVMSRKTLGFWICVTKYQCPWQLLLLNKNCVRTERAFRLPFFCLFFHCILSFFCGFCKKLIWTYSKPVCDKIQCASMRHKNLFLGECGKINRTSEAESKKRSTLRMITVLKPL